MDYNALIRKARSRNIRVTKNTRSGRRYLTASELRRKLKRRKSRSKRLTVKKTGFLGGLIGGLFGRSVRKTAMRRKLRRKLRKGRKNCVCNRRRCKCRVKRGRKYRRSVGRRGGVRAGALYALKNIATGAAIQLGSEAAKRALMTQM
jgi:hypothetical protein